MMADGAAVRRPTSTDVEAIRAIIAATEMFPPDMLDGMMAPYFAGEETELWFVRGEPAHAVAYAIPERLTNGTWNQLLIAVDPGHQGQGLGTHLMRNLERVVSDLGGRLVLVETSGTAEFEPTRSFYRAIGYVEEARIRDFYDDGDDKIVFRRALVV